MPADYASGRFALGLNECSRKIFPLGTAAALSLVISTAAHADRCVLQLDAIGEPLPVVVAPMTAPRSCATRAGAFREATVLDADTGTTVCLGRADHRVTIGDLSRLVAVPASAVRAQLR